MKIGIITHYDVHNHGAQLQLYALEKVLINLSHEAKALTYRKNYDFLDECAEKKYDISLKSIPFYIKYLFEKGVARTLFNIKKRELLQSFRTNNSMVGEYYSKAKDLDCVFVGSDEVFSIEPGLNTFFWGFGVPCKNIFAYAGCFGPTTIKFIKEKYAEEYIQAGIERFMSISVRDKNSQNIIKQLSGKQVPIVCDPVILYGYQLEKQKFSKPLQQKYLLVYAYDNNMNNKNEVDAIIAYAKSQGLLTLCAGFYHKWCDRNINVTPIELLEYIYGAEFVVTDTFHGSVMSIIMNRPFAVKIRGNRNKLGFLLDEYGLSDRATKDFNDLSSVFSRLIDYGQVNEIINEKREKSMEYLQSCLERIKDDK